MERVKCHGGILDVKGEEDPFLTGAIVAAMLAVTVVVIVTIMVIHVINTLIITREKDPFLATAAITMLTVTVIVIVAVIVIHVILVGL